MWLYEVLRNEHDYTLTQVGLAVDDVKELQKQANYHRMQLMVSIQVPTQYTTRSEYLLSKCLYICTVAFFSFRNATFFYVQVQLFIQVEDVLKLVIPYLKWIQCLAGCVKQLNRRAIRQWSVDLKVKPFWYKIAVLWGDEIGGIVTQLRKENRYTMWVSRVVFHHCSSYTQLP